ncbi:MAG: DMT family transporter [Clostridia bacterium]|nr:DMT family transporter [Clostridia bacterium]
MKRNNLKGSIILGAAALIWGLAFVAQNKAADFVPPFLFNSLRSFIGAAFLLGFLAIKKLRTKEPIFPKTPEHKRATLIGGLLCGITLALSVNFQQAGITVYPDNVANEARSGFITALYVIIVPIASVLIGKKIPKIVWGAAAVAIGGIYLLCGGGAISGIHLGDILMFGCAITFTLQILCIDRYGEAVGGARLSMIQFFICGIISGVISLFTEWGTVTYADILAAAPQILYLGIMSSGVAYTLQIVGQRFAEPAVASITMSLESVFAALGGWLISGNTLTFREIMGCALVFIAIILAQLPEIIGSKQIAKS